MRSTVSKSSRGTSSSTELDVHMDYVCPFQVYKDHVHPDRIFMGPDFEDGEGNGNPGTSVVTRPRIKTRKPSQYRVLLLNDDFTPMEFVVHVLERFFSKTVDEATQIMLHVHNHGVGECGIFTYEVAETKVQQVMGFARKHQHPLQCVMEKR